MEDVFYPTVAGLATVVLLLRLPALIRNPGDPARRALTATVASIAIGLAFGTPAIYTWFDRLTGVPNLARLLSHLGILTLGLSGQVLLLHLALEPGDVGRRKRIQRRFFLVYVVVGLTMTALFIAAPVDVDTSDYYGTYGDLPVVGAYVAVYMTYLAVGFGNLARLSWVYRRRARRPFLRSGLLLIALGSPLAVAYAVEKAVYVSARQLGYEPWSRSTQEQLSPIIGGPGGILLLIGIVLPSVGPQVLALVRYLRLRPLWQLVSRATPEIRLGVVTWTPDVLLLRRCTEIRDGIWKLRPYLSRTTAEQAQRLGEQAGLINDELVAMTTAAVVMDATRARAQGQRPTELYVLNPSGGEDLDTEAQQLLRIARRIRSPYETSRRRSRGAKSAQPDSKSPPAMPR